MEFQLKRDVFKRIVKKQIIIQLYTAIGTFAILYIALRGTDIIFYGASVFLLIYILIGHTNRFRRMKKEYFIYKIILSSNSISKTQHPYDDITILRENIKRIVELPGSGLSIQAEHDIFIPMSLENYDILRKELLEWQTIEVSPISPSAPVNEEILFKISSKNRSNILKAFSDSQSGGRTFSKLGKFSLAACIIGFISYCFNFVIVSIINIPKDNEPYLMFIPITFWLISFITGVIDLFTKGNRKSFSKVTVALCGIPLGLMLIVYLLIASL